MMEDTLDSQKQEGEMQGESVMEDLSDEKEILTRLVMRVVNGEEVIQREPVQVDGEGDGRLVGGDVLEVVYEGGKVREEEGEVVYRVAMREEEKREIGCIVLQRYFMRWAAWGVYRGLYDVRFLSQISVPHSKRVQLAKKPNVGAKRRTPSRGHHKRVASLSQSTSQPSQSSAYQAPKTPLSTSLGAKSSKVGPAFDPSKVRLKQTPTPPRSDPVPSEAIDLKSQLKKTTPSRTPPGMPRVGGGDIANIKSSLRSTGGVKLKTVEKEEEPVIDFRASLRNTGKKNFEVPNESPKEEPVMDFRSLLKKTPGGVPIEERDTLKQSNETTEEKVKSQRKPVVPLPLAPLDAPLPPPLVISKIKKEKKKRESEEGNNTGLKQSRSSYLFKV
eukprot:TRINITY_DN4033_c0_g1_i1.p1 TRINITY_DN4033_c0_g1~~TRINITY_DN4033_c0_g1_i1.p1  ORF type:complete len:411 (-),score=97.38 TRINITY_DN4033_c0_g1_i1:109-1269(-)